MKYFIILSILVTRLVLTRCDLKSVLEYSNHPVSNTKFYLYTSKNTKNPTILPLYNRSALQSSYFNKELPTRLIIHGYQGNKDSDVNQYVGKAYLKNGEFNIIVVDWSHGAIADLKNYPLAANNSRIAGQVVAKFLDFLSISANVSLSTVYLIGFSLGAHAAGFAGKSVKTGRVSTIFGLDPAGPLFHTSTSDNRLASTDADYVEIIHTHTILSGILTPIGDADFYANDGLNQRGCVSKLTSCPHQRAFRIFAESINSPIGFVAKKCDNVLDIIRYKKCNSDNKVYLVGGEPARSNRRGLFQFRTAAFYPFVIDLNNLLMYINKRKLVL